MFLVHWVWIREEVIVKTDFGRKAVVCRNPMEGCLDLTPIRRPTTPSLRVIGTVKLDHFPALLIFNHIHTLDKIGVSQSDFTTGRQTKEFLGWVLKKILLFNVKHTGKRHFPGPHIGILRIVLGVQLFDTVFRIVVYDNPKGAQHPHNSRGPFIQIFPDAVLEQCDIYGTVPFGHADTFTEFTDGFRCVAPSPQTGEGGHPRIIPSRNVALFYQVQEFSFTHHRIT